MLKGPFSDFEAFCFLTSNFTGRYIPCPR